MKIAFIVGSDGDTFLKDIIPWAMYEMGYDVRVHSVKDAETTCEQWADIIWVEWCTDAAMLVSNMWASDGGRRAKIIIRLHRWEAYTDWINHVKWSNVEKLLVVPNPYTLKQLEPLNLGDKIINFPNAVNMERWEFADPQPGKKIAYVGSLNLKKNIPFLLQCMKNLLDIDAEYKLYCAGAWQDQVVKNYVEHMIDVLGIANNVFFEGHQEDVQNWLKDKQYIVCPSLVEGHPVAVMEGMAMGLKPLIHNFPGADSFFIQKWLFDVPREFSQDVTCFQFDPKDYRDYIDFNYPFAKQAQQIEAIFEGLLA